MLAEAVPPIVPSSPKVVRNVALSIVIGLVLAIGVAILLEFVDRRVRTVDEVSELVGLPLLACCRGQVARAVRVAPHRWCRRERCSGNCPHPKEA